MGHGPFITNTACALAALTCLLACSSSAQNPAPPRSAGGVPVQIQKPAALKFKASSFTFVRIRYSTGRHGQGSSGSDRWKTDWPAGDRNFSVRFQQATGLQTDTNGLVLSLTDPQLKQYPFIYLVEPGRLDLSDAEARGLRDYLLGGGFLLMDDFWGELEWSNVQVELKRVFPERESFDVPLEHPLFHCFYDLKEKPQVASLPHVLAGRSYERADGKEVHYRALADDHGRIMAVLCHNTDLGDGWERASEDANYFREYSEKRAYPMGINIVVYALTH